ncbi:cation-translocating P-type ATPase [Gillisia sp. Hel_I_29]|uniref:cation-translocating P-type ATPase n=1 Tax=Gillisia sp. Hel_I_29 TaxID=1249975 RepID=UPI000550E7B2|nr:cation-translocating P-type ATPase [Gillisia sp. Hel_I_29]
MSENPYNFEGLNDEEVLRSRKLHGSNSINKVKGSRLLNVFKDIFLEPMFLILLATASIYFILGSYNEGIFLLCAIVLISTISFYQSARSKKALDALKEYTQTLSTVIRNNELVEIRSDEIVIDDLVVASEGELITADGELLQLNDFTVNESILTGEAFSVYKELEGPEKNLVFKGTAVVSGQCVFKTKQVGVNTKLGEIDTSLGKIKKVKSPLQEQISSFVKKMAIIGIGIFLIIWGISFKASGDLLDSLLKGLTIAMSVLPEEIPVAFATFMALGASRLMKLGIVVKQTQTIETLGSVTVLCTDKTGTITENRMELTKIYTHLNSKTSSDQNWNSEEAFNLIETAMWASESVPFDAMEKSLHHFYETLAEVDERPDYKMIHEYPLGGKPPMMTHIFQNEQGSRKIAMKGSLEAVLEHSILTKEEKSNVESIAAQLALEGLRILGVGAADFNGDEFPKTQQEFRFKFIGILGFYDPPKKNIAETLQKLYAAGIKIKILTGDNEITTAAIAKMVNFENEHTAITGEELMKLSSEEFEQKVRDTNIFTRIFPEVKLKIINTLKAQDEIVGMTGDGVNDALALKAAHIGIAMGKRGSDIAKESSSLILSDDDFSKMVEAVAMGRKIYVNLKKAIQYIISIHIPIILTVALPVVLGWIYPVIFTPIHVIFLELIMGPTCSIIYENEPLEKFSMTRAPRKMKDTFLRWRDLTVSVIQGLVITIGCLFIYQFAIRNLYPEEATRAMVFSTLIVSNIFLTLVNRSFYHSIFTTLRYKNKLIGGIVILSFMLLAIILYQPWVANLFEVTALNLSQLLILFITAFVIVFWFEIYKWIIRRNHSG